MPHKINSSCAQRRGQISVVFSYPSWLKCHTHLGLDGASTGHHALVEIGLLISAAHRLILGAAVAELGAVALAVGCHRLGTQAAGGGLSHSHRRGLGSGHSLGSGGLGLLQPPPPGSGGGTGSRRRQADQQRRDHQRLYPHPGRSLDHVPA